MNKMYIVYDDRALYDVDEATVLSCCGSLKQAKNDCKNWGNAVVYEYDCEDGYTLLNGRLVL